MLLHTSAFTFFKPITAGLLIAGAIYTYGNGILFSQLYLGTLAFIAILCYRDINILGVLALSVIVHLIINIAWLFISDALLNKALIYLMLMITLWLLKEEDHRSYITAILAASLLSELYWFITDYNAPRLHWYCLLINLNMLLRHFLLTRVFITSHFFPKYSQSLHLDFALRNLVLLYIILHELMILEYLLRHLLGWDITLIWELSSYLFHGLSTYAIWLIATEGAKIISAKLFIA